MKRKELEKLDNLDSFKNYLQGILRKQKKLTFGYDNGYYWERYWIREAENKQGVQGLKVVFDIGSDSGYWERRRYSEFVTWEDFYSLVVNKKFEEENVSLRDIIGSSAEKYK